MRIWFHRKVSGTVKCEFKTMNKTNKGFFKEVNALFRNWKRRTSLIWDAQTRL